MISKSIKDFYCSSNFVRLCPGKRGEGCKGCPDHHRKWPTPKQFFEEYGREYSDDEPVYVFSDENLTEKGKAVNDWTCLPYNMGKTCLQIVPKTFIVCICTPFGKPDKDWRP